MSVLCTEREGESEREREIFTRNHAPNELLLVIIVLDHANMLSANEIVR